jgi:hypothetical protein
MNVFINHPLYVGYSSFQSGTEVLHYTPRKKGFILSFSSKSWREEHPYGEEKSMTAMQNS